MLLFCVAVSSWNPVVGSNEWARHLLEIDLAASHVDEVGEVGKVFTSPVER